MDGAHRAPDMLIDGSGRNIVIKASDGGYYSLREGGGDFMRDLIAEQTGLAASPAMVDRMNDARCSPDVCLLTIDAGDDSQGGYRIMATRSSRWLDYEQFIETCARVDIVISDRYLPRACSPRWLRVDKRLLDRTGGLTFRWDDRSIDSVAQHNAHLPWSRYREADRGEILR